MAIFVGKHTASRKYGPKCADFVEKFVSTNAPQMFRRYGSKKRRDKQLGNSSGNDVCVGASISHGEFSAVRDI